MNRLKKDKPRVPFTVSEAAEGLYLQITKGRDLVQRRAVSEADETAWSTTSELLLAEIFGKDSPSLKGFKQAKPRQALSDFQNADALADHRRQTVVNRIQVLTSLMGLLEKNSERERQSESNAMPKAKPPANAGPTLGPGEGAARIREQIKKGHMMLQSPISSADEQAWEAVTKRILTQAFGENSDPVNSVMEVGGFAFAFGGGTDQQFAAQRREDMETRIRIMEGLAEALESDWRASSPMKTAVMPDTSKVFLVHGHEQGVVEACARMIERFDLTPIILHEQPNQGRTTIEKFEHHSDTGFAVVFLTPDDVAAPKDIRCPRGHGKT